MKMHLNLATADLEKSVSFYSTLLGAAPVKHFDDYALFITEQPGLELALDINRNARIGESAHYGVVVESTQHVDDAIARLRGANYPIDVEREETCCYAVQTKVWASDPDGRRWEVYTVHEDVVPETQEDACSSCHC
jgi:catechol 2,3-dioxygenase-like lactoylglutathione lyase family enzyme